MEFLGIWSIGRRTFDLRSKVRSRCRRQRVQLRADLSARSAAPLRLRLYRRNTKGIPGGKGASAIKQPTSASPLKKTAHTPNQLLI